MTLNPFMHTPRRRGERNGGPGLRLEVEHQRSCSLLTVAGEVDVAGMPMFEEALVRLTPVRGHVLVIDLESVSFVDSGIVAALLTASDRWRAAGGELLIHKMSAPVRRILELHERLGYPVFDRLGLTALEERAV